MNYLVRIISLFQLGAILVLAEPSVYANRSFSSSQKILLQNKKTISMLRQKIAQQNEQIDGLRSIVEGLSATVNQLQQNSHTVVKNSSSTSDSALLHQLGTMIDKINSEYVSKSELQEILKSDINYSSANKEITKVKERSSKSLENKKTLILYSEGVRLFVKQRYDEAKKRFIITDTKGYKPAASNYYLGEISYYTKKYEDAIFYFKKSAGLNDQASYIDTLLLHTAISLEKSGEKEQAKTFYENIIANYSEKKSAKIAKQKLKKL